MMKKCRPLLHQSFFSSLLGAKILILIWLTLNPCYLLAQQSFTISGTISDKKETLPGAAVYLAGYQIATVTDSNGKFVIKNLKPGNYDLLVQMIGYVPTAKKVVINNESANVTIMLQESTTQLSEVVIKAHTDATPYLRIFRAYFLGITPNAARCEILNPEVLTASNDKTNKILTIKANDFLIIENEALGYRIKYLLNTFEYDYDRNIVYYAGKPAFEEMTGTTAKQQRWKKEREIAYQGSNVHFFKALIKNELEQEGFLLFKQAQKNNPDRPSDSLINAKIQQFSVRGIIKKNSVGQISKNDSLNYWTKKKAEPNTIKIKQMTSVLADTLLKKYDDVFKSMNFTGELIVVFTKELELKYHSFAMYRQQRPDEYKNFQTSIIKCITPEVLLYENGMLADPRSIFYNGVWAYQKMADMVPMDYVTNKTK